MESKCVSQLPHSSDLPPAETANIFSSGRDSSRSCSVRQGVHGQKRLHVVQRDVLTGPGAKLGLAACMYPSPFGNWAMLKVSEWELGDNGVWLLGFRVVWFGLVFKELAENVNVFSLIYVSFLFFVTDWAGNNFTKQSIKFWGNLIYVFVLFHL